MAFAVLPIFAHGCHRGEHDEEPLFVPVEQRVEPAVLESSCEPG